MGGSKGCGTGADNEMGDGSDGEDIDWDGRLTEDIGAGEDELDGGCGGCSGCAGAGD